MAAPAAGSSPAVASSGSSSTFPAAATERRVHPRHFHAGRNPTAAAAPSTSSDAAVAEAGRPPPASHLYRHALESIFGWLNQRELATVLQVSSSWLDAVESMANLELTVEQTSASLRDVADSAVGRHVSRLGSEDHRVPLTADSLFIVAKHMPQLRELRCGMKLTPAEGRLTFPPALQTLEVRVIGDSAAMDVSATLRSIGSLSLLSTLIVELPTINDQLSLAPLASLPQLRDLGIIASDDDTELSDAQVAELRALPLLHCVDIMPTPSSLRRLLKQPHQLQWQQITLLGPLDDETAAALTQLPSLTKIFLPFSGSHFDWLQQLPNLTHLDFQIDRSADEDGAPMDLLVAALQRCTKIEYLHLAHCAGLHAAHLADLLPRLPRLRTLKLMCLGIDSLSFLAQAPVTQQLSSLALSWCAMLPVIELRHVHALRGLKSLTSYRSFATPLDDHSRWLLTPPSVALPQLEKFEYSAP